MNRGPSMFHQPAARPDSCRPTMRRRFSRRSAIRGTAALGLAALAAGTTTRRSTGTKSGAEPSRPFPQRVAYVPDTIRPSARIREEQDEDVRVAYDRWKALYLVR